MNILILEDEPLALSRIKQIITENFSDIEVVGTAQDVESGIELLKNSDYDLLLTDIHLADGLSFEIFEQIEVKCPTIFITAYDQYAIQSFDHNCIDYILKPVKEEALLKALNKAKHKISQSDPTEVVPKALIQTLIELHTKKKYKKRFICKMGNHVAFKSVDEIAYFYIEDKVVFLQEADSNKKYIISHSLDELENDLLDPDNFYRINRSMIVNLDHLLEMKKYNNGRLKLLVKPNINNEIIVARERVSSFKDWIDQ